MGRPEIPCAGRPRRSGFRSHRSRPPLPADGRPSCRSWSPHPSRHWFGGLGFAADYLDEQNPVAGAKSPGFSCPASIRRSDGGLRRPRSERDEHDNNDDDSNEETCDSKVQKKPECEEDLHVVHDPDNFDRDVRTRDSDRPKLVLAKPALLRLAFKTAMIRNSCRGKRSVVQTREQRAEPLPR